MEVLPTISGHWGWLLFAVFQKLSKSHLIAQPIIRDTNNLLAKMPKILNFSSYELKLGEEFLRSVGCENNKFVCLMVRDSTYLSTIRKDKDFSHYEYRDSKISTYLEGAEKLAELGYTVFRMGQIVKDPLKSSNSKVIDYATNGMRTEFLDIFLGAHCSFYVSTGTGIDTVAQIFRRPMLYLNVIGFYDDIATNNYLFYPKTYFDEFSLKNYRCVKLRCVA